MCAQSEALKHNIDISFINKLEGYSNVGYVPKNDVGKVLGKSGVTIGYGFDIGQHNVWEINRLEIPQKLKAMLTPYTELTGEEASQKLENSPLKLSNEQVATLDREVKKKQIRGILRLSESFKIIFHKLPDCVQTGVFSVYYNYGTLSGKLMDLVKNAKYNAVANYVRSLKFNSARREKEAAKIESCIGERKWKTDSQDLNKRLTM